MEERWLADHNQFDSWSESDWVEQPWSHLVIMTKVEGSGLLLDHEWWLWPRLKKYSLLAVSQKEEKF